MYYYYDYHSPVGKLMIASDEKNIVGLWLEGQKYFMDVLEEKAYQEKRPKLSGLLRIGWIGILTEKSLKSMSCQSNLLVVISEYRYGKYFPKFLTARSLRTVI